VFHLLNTQTSSVLIQIKPRLINILLRGRCIAELFLVSRYRWSPFLSDFRKISCN